MKLLVSAIVVVLAARGGAWADSPDGESKKGVRKLVIKNGQN